MIAVSFFALSSSPFLCYCVKASKSAAFTSQSLVSSNIPKQSHHCFILPPTLLPPDPPFPSIHGRDERRRRRRCRRWAWSPWPTPVLRAVCGRVGAAAAPREPPEEASACRRSLCRGRSLTPRGPQGSETGPGAAPPGARRQRQGQSAAWCW